MPCDVSYVDVENVKSMRWIGDGPDGPGGLVLSIDGTVGSELVLVGDCAAVNLLLLRARLAMVAALPTKRNGTCM